MAKKQKRNIKVDKVTGKTTFVFDAHTGSKKMSKEELQAHLDMKRSGASKTKNGKKFNDRRKAKNDLKKYVA